MFCSRLSIAYLISVIFVFGGHKNRDFSQLFWNLSYLLKIVVDLKAYYFVSGKDSGTFGE